MRNRMISVAALAGSLFLQAPVSIEAQAIRSVRADTTRAAGDTLRGPTGEIRWKHRNHAKQGAIIGGVTGGVAGAGYLVILGAIAAAENSDTPSPVALGFLGGFLGAASGAALGALIGSAFQKSPSHGDAAPSPEPSVTPLRPFDETRTFGSVLIQPVLMTGGPGFGAGGGLQLSLLSRRSRAFHLGIEGAWFPTQPAILTFGGVARFYPTGRAGFYLVGDIGNYRYRYTAQRDPITGEIIPGGFSTSLLGGGLGAGLEFTKGPLRIGVEGRRRINLQNVDEPGRFSFTQVGVTLRYLW